MKTNDSKEVDDAQYRKNSKVPMSRKEAFSPNKSIKVLKQVSKSYNSN